MTVPQGKYPAKAHLKKVIEWLKSKGETLEGTLYLEGQKLKMLEDSDEPVPFRQRRYFFYFTGCSLPDCAFAYDIKNDKSTLFIPPIDPDEVMWSGLPMTPEEAMKKYEVDQVKTTDQINPFLASSEVTKNKIYSINGQISDDVTFLAFDSTDTSLLKTAIEECRVIKTPYEIEMIRHANTVSTAGHIALMKASKTASNERDLAALFFKESITRGCTEQSYPPIMAGGTNAATLHYPHNNSPLAGKQMVLVDAGAEYDCYASDITRTWPLGGGFSPEAKALYELVLKMQKETIPMLKAGVSWDDVHAHAHRVAIKGLIEMGIFKGDAEEIFEARTSTAFFPHGLGHYLGMDTHDTGGNPNYKDSDPMFRYLRKRGTLPAGSIITVEPGVYFCRFIIEPFLKSEKHSKFIDQSVLDKYWEVGGVRIEDNVLITESGYENLTDTPKEVDDILKLVNS